MIGRIIVVYIHFITGGHCAAINVEQACGATTLLARAFAPQLLLKSCADAPTASAIQIRLCIIVFHSNMIKLKKKRKRGT